MLKCKFVFEYSNGFSRLLVIDSIMLRFCVCNIHVCRKIKTIIDILFCLVIFERYDLIFFN